MIVDAALAEPLGEAHIINRRVEARGTIRPTRLDAGIARRSNTTAEGYKCGFHGGEKVKGRACHEAVDSQGTLLTVHVRAANKADGAEAGTVTVQVAEADRTPSRLDPRRSAS